GVGGGVGTIRGSLTINSGGTVVTLATDALGFNGGAQVDTVTVNAGGTFDNLIGGNEAFITNFILNGGTVQSTSGGRINFNQGYGVSTTISGVSSTFSAPVQIRGSALLVDI